MATEWLSKTDFDHEVQSLLRLKGQVAAALRPAVEAILRFAKSYRDVHRRIGPNYDRRVALRARLGLDEYQHQRLMAIAAQANTLTQFSRALPPAVEPLYEIARLTRDAAGEKRLRRAVERQELTPTSGIREIRSIRKAAHRRSAKLPTTTGPELRLQLSLEFVVEADAMLRWDAVEQFKMELAELLSKHGLRFGASGRLKNEAAVKQSIDRHWAKQDRTNRALSGGELNALRAEADKLNAQYTDRVQRRVEQAVRRFIDRRWKAKFGKALRSTKGKSFASKKERWRYAEDRAAIYRDEVTGGVLDSSAAWVNSARELDVLTDRARREGGIHVGAGGSHSPSMLLQALELGSDSNELAQVIMAARNAVHVPKRLEQITTSLERADAVYRQEHAAEIDADVANQRELVKHSRSKRVSWVSASPSSATKDSQVHEPPRGDESAD
jgi:hypothetical protein